MTKKLLASATFRGGAARIAPAGGMPVCLLVLAVFLVSLTAKVPAAHAQTPVPIFIMGESSYLYSLAITGRQHALDALSAYLEPRLGCSFTLKTPTSDSFNADGFRIWGLPFNDGVPVDRDLNTIKEYLEAKNFVSAAVANHQTPIVIIAYGPNESKDIVNGDKTLKTVAKFKSYLDQAKSSLEKLGARVIVATPTKGCPFADRDYDPEGMLGTLAQGIRSWYPGYADIYTLFDNYTCTDHSPCPGPALCEARCLINVSPYNSPGFPDRDCASDYCHPNAVGYSLVAQALGNAVLGLKPCPAAAATPTPTRAPTPTPTKTSTPTPTPVSSGGEYCAVGGFSVEQTANDTLGSQILLAETGTDRASFFYIDDKGSGLIKESGVMTGWAIKANTKSNIALRVIRPWGYTYTYVGGSTIKTLVVGINRFDNDVAINVNKGDIVGFLIGPDQPLWKGIDYLASVRAENKLVYFKYDVADRTLPFNYSESFDSIHNEYYLLETWGVCHDRPFCENKVVYRDDPRNTPGLYYLDSELYIQPGETVAPGEKLVYAVRGICLEPVPVVITDDLPANVTFVDADKGCTYWPETRQVSCSYICRPDDIKRAFRVQVSQDASGILTNTAVYQPEGGQASTCSVSREIRTEGLITLSGKTYCTDKVTGAKTYWGGVPVRLVYDPGDRQYQYTVVATSGVDGSWTATRDKTFWEGPTNKAIRPDGVATGVEEFKYAAATDYYTKVDNGITCTDSNLEGVSFDAANDIYESAGCARNTADLTNGNVSFNLGYCPEAAAANLHYAIKPLGMAAHPDLSVTVRYRGADGEVKSVSGTASYDGAYYGSISLRPDVYDFQLRLPRHLPVVFKEVIVSEGENSVDWKNKVILAGNVVADDVIDIFDLATVVDNLDATGDPVALTADVDYDGTVTIFDLAQVVENLDARGEAL